ncbi:MAG: hypothetical protein ACLP7F_25010 [Acidimicrobiales bacterium]|jgi:hypothetical protein
MAVTEVPYSSFLRGPSEVLPALEHGDVQLDRRDAEALVMTRARRYRAAMRGTSLASAMVRDLAKNDVGLAARLLAEQLPWLAWMPRAEQEDCLAEILTHLAAGAETGTFEPFARSLGEWEHTAEVWADPELAKRLSSELPGKGKTIPRPKAER